MRSFMYAYGYRNRTAAREALDGEDVSRLPCAGCPECKVACAAGFDVRGKVLDIARIRSVPPEFLA